MVVSVGCGSAGPPARNPLSNGPAVSCESRSQSAMHDLRRPRKRTAEGRRTRGGSLTVPRRAAREMSVVCVLCRMNRVVRSPNALVRRSSVPSGECGVRVVLCPLMSRNHFSPRTPFPKCTSFDTGGGCHGTRGAQCSRVRTRSLCVPDKIAGCLREMATGRPPVLFCGPETVLSRRASLSKEGSSPTFLIFPRKMGSLSCALTFCATQLAVPKMPAAPGRRA